MRVVVLGTARDVGKTYVTCRIAEDLRGGTCLLALKPIETGVSSADSGDAGAIAAAAGHAPPASPWRFARAVSPHLAAREAGVLIETRPWAEWIAAQERRAAPETRTRSSPSIALVETAGGAFSPVGPALTNVDLALSLEPAVWLLVAHDSLGVLHDVTATLRALPRLPDAIVLSSARPADDSSGSNARELRTLGIAPRLWVVGRNAPNAEPLVAWLRDQTGK